MNIEIIHKSKPTHDSISLHFRKRGILRDYKAGQHALLSLRINGKSYKRTYSFHTAPDVDDHVAITVRAVDGGIVSNYLQTANTPEDITLDGVAGEFVIEAHADKKRHAVMFAGGSGITPIIGMIKTVLHNEPDSTVSLVYANKNRERIIFRDELLKMEQEFKNRLTVYHILTQEENNTPEFPVFYKGRPPKLIIKKLLKKMFTENSLPFEYYLCGPFSFMQLVEDVVRTVSPDAQVLKEHFFIPDEKPAFDPSGLQQREVMLRKEGSEQLLTVPAGKTILEAALDRAIMLPHSCLEGKCGTCRALLLGGDVVLRRNHALTDDDIAAGHILLCQAFPTSDGVVIKAK